MIKFVLDHLQTKQKCKKAVNELSFVIKCVPDQFKIQKRCDEVIIEHSKILGFILDWYKSQNMCDKAFDNYSHVFILACDWYKIQRMSNNVVSTYFFVVQFVTNCYNIQGMWDKAVDACLKVLEITSEWFVTKKMHGNGDIVFGYIESDIVTFFSGNMDLNTIGLNNINPVVDKFVYYDLEIVIHVALMGWCNREKQRETYKKDLSKELMTLVWHSTRC